MEPWAWVLIILLILAFLVGIFLLVYFLVIRKRLPPKLDNPKVVGGQVIAGNWTGGRNFDDVNLYASASPITLNAQGRPTTTTFVSQPFITGTNSVILTQITPGTYFTALVATNSTGGVFRFSQDNVTVKFEVPVEFNILNETKTGGLVLQDDNTTVLFETNPDLRSDSAIWMYDARRTEEQQFRPNLTVFSKKNAGAAGGSVVIFDDGGNLSAKQFGEFGANDVAAVAAWVFSDGKWCLASDFSKCITLISPENKQPLDVAEGTIWVNDPAPSNPMDGL